MLLALAGVAMVAGGILHLDAYPALGAVLQTHPLPLRFALLYQGLWLSESATVLVLGASYGWLALSGRAIPNWVLLAFGAMPLLSAFAIYETVGNFFPGHILLLAAFVSFGAASASQKRTFEADACDA